MLLQVCFVQEHLALCISPAMWSLGFQTNVFHSVFADVVAALVLGLGMDR